MMVCSAHRELGTDRASRSLQNLLRVDSG